jgi:hypothetical protein
MSTIALNLPRSAKWIGAFHDKSKLHNLDQDMLSVELPGDVFVDVGWYPDWCEDGEYRVTVYQGDYDNRLEAVVKTKDTTEAKRTVESLVWKHTPAISAISSTTSKSICFGKLRALAAVATFSVSRVVFR